MLRQIKTLGKEEEWKQFKLKLLQDKEVAFAKVLEKLVHEWGEAEGMSSSASQVNPNHIHLEAPSEDSGSLKDVIQNA